MKLRWSTTVPVTLMVATPLSLPWLAPALFVAAVVMVTVPLLLPVEAVFSVVLMPLEVRLLIRPGEVVVVLMPVPEAATVALVVAASAPLLFKVIVADWVELSNTRPKACVVLVV